VSHAAVEALVELGYPYALEVPPELFAEARAAATGKRAGGSNPGLGMGLSLVAGALELVPPLFIAFGLDEKEPWVLFWGLLVVVTSFVPAFLATVEPVLRVRWLHTLLCLLVALPGLVWLGGALLVLVSTLSSGEWWGLLALLPLGHALMRLIGAWNLYEPPPTGEE
jgi:hypothetical protein